MTNPQVTNSGAAQSGGGTPAKPGKIGFWAPALIALFIAATLAGTYYVRRGMLERAMVDAMGKNDKVTVVELQDQCQGPARSD